MWPRRLLHLPGCSHPRPWRLALGCRVGAAAGRGPVAFPGRPTCVPGGLACVPKRHLVACINLCMLVCPPRTQDAVDLHTLPVTQPHGCVRGIPAVCVCPVCVHVHLHSVRVVCTSVPVTIGPPENIRVTPGPGSLTLSFSPPFHVEPATAHFAYCVRYWTLGNAGDPQVRVWFFSFDVLFFEFLMQQKKADVDMVEENRTPQCRPRVWGQNRLFKLIF